MNNKEVYLSLGIGRLLNIIVYLDNKIVYEGMIEDAPEEIKKLKYSKVIAGNKFTYYVYSEMQ